MLAPDYQEFANRGRAGHRDNSVISSVLTGFRVEIARALRDCHAAEPARKQNFLPIHGHRPRRQRPDLPAALAR